MSDLARSTHRMAVASWRGLQTRHSFLRRCGRRSWQALPDKVTRSPLSAACAIASMAQGLVGNGPCPAGVTHDPGRRTEIGARLRRARGSTGGSPTTTGRRLIHPSAFLGNPLHGFSANLLCLSNSLDALERQRTAPVFGQRTTEARDIQRSTRATGNTLDRPCLECLSQGVARVIGGRGRGFDEQERSRETYGHADRLRPWFPRSGGYLQRAGTWSHAESIVMESKSVSLCLKSPKEIASAIKHPPPGMVSRYHGV